MKTLGPMLPIESVRGEPMLIQRVVETIQVGELVAVVKSNTERPHLVVISDDEIEAGIEQVIEQVIEPERTTLKPKEPAIRELRLSGRRRYIQD